MRGYKAFDANLQCRGFQYEAGKTYELEGELRICKNGFHFCRTIWDCYKHYPEDGKTRICEVRALGRVQESGDKLCTDRIEIVSEVLDPDEVRANSGKYSSGYHNSGNHNSGYYNSGNHNSGDYNSGNHNSGDYNSGDYNSGDYNSGDYNSGNYNSGYYNSGDYNSGHHNSGCFNTDEHPKIIMFNKQSEWTYCDWLESKAFGILQGCPMAWADWVNADEMTDDEKAAHPEYETTGGILAKWKPTVTPQEWWDGLDESDKREVMSLPNFDADIFREITGIDVKMAVKRGGSR